MVVRTRAEGQEKKGKLCIPVATKNIQSEFQCRIVAICSRRIQIWFYRKSRCPPVDMLCPGHYSKNGREGKEQINKDNAHKNQTPIQVVKRSAFHPEFRSISLRLTHSPLTIHLPRNTRIGHSRWCTSSFIEYRRDTECLH